MGKRLIILGVLLGLFALVLPAQAQVRNVTLGTGTRASCTEPDLRTIIEASEPGTLLNLDFNCGRSLHTFTLTRPLRILADTAINGGGRIWFNGGDTTQIFHVYDSSLELSRVVLVRGSATSRDGTIVGLGGAISVVTGNLTLNRVTLIANTATNGGAVATQNATVRIEDTVFQGNRANLVGGAAIFINSNVLILNSSFRFNHTDGRTGAIHASDGGTLELDTVILDRNRSGDSAGALVADRLVSLVARNLRVTQNRTVGWGGAFRISDVPTTAIVDSVFSNNRADIGGAIDINNTTVPGAILITGTQFDGNQALSTGNSGGGAIALGAGVTASISDSRFFDNSAVSVGAALTANGPRLDIADTEFVSNQTTEATPSSGNSIMRLFPPVTASFSQVRMISNEARYSVFNSGILTVERSGFYRNTGSLINGRSLTVLSSTFLSNATVAITSFSAADVDMNLIVRKSIFLGNGFLDGSTFSMAGAISISDLFEGTRRPGTVLIEDSQFISNQGYVGAIFSRSVALRIENSIFMRNEGRLVGAVINESNPGSSVIIVQSTFSDNSGSNGAIYNLRGSAGATLVNSIVQHEGITCNGVWGYQGNNMQFGGDRCAGVRVANALLDRIGRPGPGSPAIDTATTGTCLADDISDTTRPQGAACDVGAYELGIAVAPIVLASPQPTATLIPVPIPTQALVNCAPFRPTSPLDGLPNGVATFYWDGAPGATSYIVRVFNEQGVEVGTFPVSGTTNVQGDVSTGAIGGGFSFRWDVLAVLNGRVVCTAPGTTMLRETPPNNPPPQATSVPQCGNGIQEPGETQNTCPNGF